MVDIANTNGPASAEPQDKSRHLDTAELIDRLAENLRRTSGIDLPHAYFVDQVRLQLAGNPAFDATVPADAHIIQEKVATATRYKTSAMFSSWAMRD